MKECRFASVFRQTGLVRKNWRYRRDAVVLHGDNALSWESMAMAARAAETCTREARQSNGRVEKMPVFRTIFSVR